MASTLDWLVALDKKVFLLFHHLHAGWLDGPMLFVTSNQTWMSFYLLFAAWFVHRYWRDYDKRVFFFIFLAMLTVVIVAQLSACAIKPAVSRYRPCHDENLAQHIRLITGDCGKKWSFTSSHAAMAFALAGFMLFSFPKDKLMHYVLFANAVLVSYSRIYVGVHYPTDLVGGALLGMTMGYVMSVVMYFHPHHGFTRSPS